MIDLTSDASQPYTFAIIDLNINCLNYKVDDIVLFCCFVSLAFQCEQCAPSNLA